jgi:hypothetical protein
MTTTATASRTIIAIYLRYLSRTGCTDRYGALADWSCVLPFDLMLPFISLIPMSGVCETSRAGSILLSRW